MDWLSAIMGALIGVFIGGYLNHHLSKRRWIDDLRFDLYKDAISALDLYEEEFFDESVQNDNNNIPIVLNDKVRLTFRTRRLMGSVVARLDDLYEEAPKAFRKTFKYDILGGSSSEYIALRHSFQKLMAKEMGLPQKGRTLKPTKYEIDKFENRKKQIRSQ